MVSTHITVVGERKSQNKKWSCGVHSELFFWFFKNKKIRSNTYTCISDWVYFLRARSFFFKFIKQLGSSMRMAVEWRRLNKKILLMDFMQASNSYNPCSKIILLCDPWSLQLTSTSPASAQEQNPRPKEWMGIKPILRSNQTESSYGRNY